MAKDIDTLGVLQDYIGELVAHYGRDRACFVADKYEGGSQLGIYLKDDEGEYWEEVRYYPLDYVRDSPELTEVK